MATPQQETRAFDGFAAAERKPVIIGADACGTAVPAFDSRPRCAGLLPVFAGDSTARCTATEDIINVVNHM